MKQKRMIIKIKRRKDKRYRLWSLGGATTPALTMKKCTKSWN
jgi:hypothetical protein